MKNQKEKKNMWRKIYQKLKIENYVKKIDKKIYI
jgi:hypothetical protein